ncbi:cell wall / vacuolar inhibitor of fructosidase 2-like [Amaranthus tricolor]|uniref:cell wall / vacuolar inhibitor of fructosidase 2-like n=1 Tax=Amaranthus tricolor TaxID=29722 RepID=UPI00258A0938|nr:cell wall / vacuolar inhibitor of fructosidase 2-like [Amaranthus tricolor]
MGKLSILYALFLIITLNTSTNTIKEVKGDAEFIKKTCKNTKYFNLCISSLKSDPTSSVSDLKGLASIMINIGMANASETYTYLSSQLPSTSIITDHNTKIWD